MKSAANLESTANTTVRGADLRFIAVDAVKSLIGTEAVTNVCVDISALNRELPLFLD